jgi:hypothetical protein
MKTKHHKYLLALAILATPAVAQDTPAAPVVAPAASAATLPKATLWAAAWKTPQGIVLGLQRLDPGLRIRRRPHRPLQRRWQEKTVAAKDLKGPTMLIRMGKTVLVA